MDVGGYFVSRRNSTWCWFCRNLPKIKPFSVRTIFSSLTYSMLFSLTLYFFSCVSRYNQVLVERLSRSCGDSKDLNFPAKYCQSYFSQFLACLWKQNLSYWRNPQYTAVRFFYTLIISLMLGTICWRFGSKRFLSTFIVTWTCFVLTLLCHHHILVITIDMLLSTGIHSRIYSMQWDPCMLQCCSLELQMALLSNQLFPLKDLSHTERELQGCTQLYHLHLLRFPRICVSFISS